jgi:hypothetical protein
VLVAYSVLQLASARRATAQAPAEA